MADPAWAGFRQIASEYELCPRSSKAIVSATGNLLGILVIFSHRSDTIALSDLTLFEVDEAMHIIHDAADPDANIIFGTVADERLQNEMKITVIATGFEKSQAAENLHNFPVRQNTASPTTPRTVGNANPTSSSRQEDYDVPTFIRKKAD